ncbi:MAG: 4-(cytidine 5'-diphospho)-2-C-methyl-D-erythritol kinase [Clostridiales bacterium GWF2_38_85]|nr:MAG: 4-(cytidine 5'-diphospho)-2-C-methyl-D-erythritol kinase [Clostridiales bacterium GWF2_38_85]HBL84252.1 4-(cytidine 5'-diphospho)-2-C-methyl-D-erythritol kinase [Clostridiales bacterium]
MNEIIEKAYAKINLTLSVSEKRPDSYHNITTVMQSVTLFDTLYITKADEIRLACSRRKLPGGADNIAYHAAQVFFQHTGISGGADIVLQKHIPVAAGLAGGSTDAAAVLRGLNKLYNTKLSNEELQKLGRTFGADVPFCISGGTALATGIGDTLTPVENNTLMPLVIAIGSEGVSTKTMYDLLDNKPERLHVYTDDMIDALKSGSQERVAELLANDFESVCMEIRNSVPQLKNHMIQLNALGASMSGSGTSVFGLFRSYTDAESAANNLRQKGFFATACGRNN